MRIDELERELRAERPKLDPDFARKLDDWAAAGFPRGGELGPERGSSLRDRFTRPRNQPRKRKRQVAGGMLVPVGAAVMLLAIVVGIGVVGTVNRSEELSGGASEATLDAGGEEAVPPTQQETADEAAAGERGFTQKLAAPDAAGFSRNLDGRRTAQKIAQNVDLALATAPEDFRDTADGVLDVVDEHRGFVLRSSVSGGDPNVEGAKQGRATFEIRVPAGQLQAAIASLSDLGHVVSRTDGTVDITSRFDSAKRRIAAYTESRDRLLRQLEDAVTETEQEAIRAQLRIVEAQLDAAEADLGDAQQRVHLVPVSVTVSSDESVTGGDGGDWDVGDALDDAGKVLTVAAGVLLISAAVLLPLAILVAIGWLIAGRARRRARERTLDA